MHIEFELRGRPTQDLRITFITTILPSNISLERIFSKIIFKFGTNTKKNDDLVPQTNIYNWGTGNIISSHSPARDFSLICPLIFLKDVRRFSSNQKKCR